MSPEPNYEVSMLPLQETRIVIVPDAADMCADGSDTWDITRVRALCNMRTYATDGGANFDIVVLCPELSQDEVRAASVATLAALAKERQATVALVIFAGKTDGGDGATYSSQVPSPLYEGNPSFVGVVTREFFESFGSDAWRAFYEERLEMTALAPIEYGPDAERILAAGVGHFEEMDWYTQVVVARWNGTEMIGRAFAVVDLYPHGA